MTVISYQAAAADKGSTFAPPPCPNEIVDVYLSPLKRGPGSEPTYLKPGPPPVHLRLPRQRLRVDLPDVWAVMTNCDQKTFAGWRAVYLSPSDLARGLGIPYDFPRLRDYKLEFSARDPDEQPPSPQALPPVNDATDREGMARKGSWNFDSNNREVSGKFCLDPPAPSGQCYASVGWGSAYTTDHVTIYTQSLMDTTFGTSTDVLWKQITIADIDAYFAFLRRIADLVVVKSCPACQP